MILVTGGAGYIGSHTCVELLNAGEEIVAFDNFCNSSRASLRRVEQICNKQLAVVEGDIRDQDAIEAVLAAFECTCVLHFAGLKSVQESVASPLEYYDVNVVGTHRLLRATSIERYRFLLRCNRICSEVSQLANDTKSGGDVRRSLAMAKYQSRRIRQLARVDGARMKSFEETNL